MTDTAEPADDGGATASQDTSSGGWGSGSWETASSPPYRWRWWALATVVLATIMDLLDSLVTTIAGPSIESDLGGGGALIQWLTAGYTLALAAGLMIGGRLGDVFGRRRMFLVGMAGFTVASVLCGLAQDPTMLVVLRVVQGLLGAAMLPQGMGMIKEIFPYKEMGAAFGVLGPAIGIGTIAGPILSGVLINADLWGTGWRMIFLINLPLGLLAVAGALAFMPSGQESWASRLDVVGAAIVAVSALLLVYPVVQGRDAGWPAWTFVSMVAGLVGFALFTRYERRVDARGDDPLVTPSLFGKRAFTGGIAAGFLLFTSITGFTLVLSIFLQIGLGYSALTAALVTLPQAGGSVVGFFIARATSAKLGRRLIHIGLTVLVVGVLALGGTLLIAGAGVSGWALAPGLVLFGVGTATAMAPFYTIVVAGVDASEAGAASGTLTALQQFGGASGAAVMGTVFFGIAGTMVPAGAVADAARGGYVETAVWTLVVTLVLLVLAAATAFLLPARAASAWGGGSSGGGSSDGGSSWGEGSSGDGGSWGEGSSGNGSSSWDGAGSEGSANGSEPARSTSDSHA